MADPLRFTVLDHISLTVANPQRALDFYTGVFGAELRQESGSEHFYVRLGSSYLVLGQVAEGRRAGYIDHFCAGCEGVFQKPVEERLKEIKVQYTTPPPFGIFFNGPDGVPIELWMGDSWLDVARTAPIVSRPMSGPRLFEPIRVANVNVGVPNVAGASPYYDQLFPEAITTISGPNRTVTYTIGKSTLTLRPALEGAAIESVGILVRDIPTGISVKLRSLGATVDSAQANKRINFQDPDGVRISVIAE